MDTLFLVLLHHPPYVYENFLIINILIVFPNFQIDRYHVRANTIGQVLKYEIVEESATVCLCESGHMQASWDEIFQAEV